MKVAIMGAGISGLTCAIILERAGIYPTIYEKRGSVNDRFINAEAMLSILHRPITDTYRFLAEEFKIYLKPTSSINQMNILSERSNAVINEHIGFLNIRGRHHNALERQLAEQVKSDIHFHTLHTYEELLSQYTHIILATGDASDSMNFKNFREDFSVSLQGATVEGKFECNSVTIWLNHNLAPQGYGYILPFSDTEANIVIAYPNLSKDSLVDPNTLWDRFYQRACHDMNQSLKITDGFQITNYKMGICKYPRIGNTLFVGNCFGAMMPFMGFGQFESILTGIYAAYDLSGQGDYDELTKEIRNSYAHSLTLRRTLESMSNPSLDFIVKHLDGYLGKRLFKLNQRNPLKLFSYLVRPFV